MQQILSSFNLILAIALGGAVALGMLLGEIRVRALAFGLSAGFVAAEILPETITKLIPSISNNVDRKLVLMWALAGVFIGASFVGQRHAQRSVRTIFFAIATALFGVAISLALLPVGTRQGIITNFNLAAMIYDIRMYIVLAEIALIIVFTAIPLKSKEEKKHRKHRKK